MKSIVLALSLLFLITGCTNASNSSNESQSNTLVSNFVAPGLAGFVVQDHPKGARAVETPEGVFQEGAVFTTVNGTPVRNAEHFRELIDGVYQREEELSVNYSVGQ